MLRVLELRLVQSIEKTSKPEFLGYYLLIFRYSHGLMELVRLQAFTCFPHPYTKLDLPQFFRLYLHNIMNFVVVQASIYYCTKLIAISKMIVDLAVTSLVWFLEFLPNSYQHNPS